MHYEIKKKLQQCQKGMEDGGLSSEKAKQYEAKLCLIDTSLLKCYIKVGVYQWQSTCEWQVRVEDLALD